MPASRLLAVLTSDPDGPVVRHRWQAYGRFLADAGIVLEVVPWTKRPGQRRRALQRASTADGVVLSSRLLGVRDVRRLRRRARRLLFDFDDALPFRDSARGATRSRTRERRFRAILEAADRVSAGNAYLAGLAGDHAVGATILPTTVPMAETPERPEPPEPPGVVGWIGSKATVPYVEDCALVLSALVAAGHIYRLRIIADAAPTLPPGIHIDFVPWVPETWQARLSEIHLGIAPLPDDAWTRGKCGLKVLQMLAAGRPVVASAVGVQREQIREGETGFLAEDRDSFLRGMLALLENPERRRAMGAAGRADVAAHWSVEAWGPKVVAEVEALLA